MAGPLSCKQVTQVRFLSVPFRKTIYFGVASEWDLSVAVTHVPSGFAVRFRTAPIVEDVVYLMLGQI